jgi:hypothetical protein
LPSNIGDILRSLTFKPLQLLTAAYLKWSERHLMVNEIREAQRKIAEAADEGLAHFHNELWSYWPDVVQHVREYTRREEPFHE